jgi:predicted transposase YdaD
LLITIFLLPKDYVEKLALNIPDRLNKLLADVITVLLNRINVPKEEIEEITDYIYQRRTQEMFEFFEDYDVQETRRIARAEGKAEEKAASKAALLQTAQKLKVLGLSNSTISDATGLSLDEIEQI